jgi:TRAP-type transport system small permease protein
VAEVKTETGARQERGPLFYIGAASLLLATGVETLAVIGRHIGVPLLGTLEIIQACILVLASAAMLATTLNDSHASVTLLTARVNERWRRRLRVFSSALSAAFFICMAAGALWLTIELWNDHESSELLRIPYKPLRILSFVAAAAIAIVFVRDLWRAARGRS